MSEFTHFELPNENWSKMPHMLIECLPQIKSLAEMKVILYILRHTWGYQEFDDWDAKAISTDEFINGRKKADGTRIDSGIGMNKQSVYSGLKNAVEHGFIICLIDNTDLGRVTHYYRLRMDSTAPGYVHAIDPEKERNGNPWHDIPKEVKNNVYARSQGRCAYCDCKSTVWHYDHIMPKSRGGTDEEHNLALACPRCNLSKNAKTPDEWGKQAHYYDGDVQKSYRGWCENHTGGGMKIIPRTEKETTERNVGKKTTTPPETGDVAEPKPSPVKKKKAKKKSKPRSPIFNKIALLAYGIQENGYVKGEHEAMIYCCENWLNGKAANWNHQHMGKFEDGATPEDIVQFVQWYRQETGPDISVPRNPPTFAKWYRQWWSGEKQRRANRAQLDAQIERQMQETAALYERIEWGKGIFDDEAA